LSSSGQVRKKRIRLQGEVVVCRYILITDPGNCTAGSLRASLPDHAADRALMMALRIAMMIVRNKFQSDIFRSPPLR
jgi:hypothetical protein